MVAGRGTRDALAREWALLRACSWVEAGRPVAAGVLDMRNRGCGKSGSIKSRTRLVAEVIFLWLIIALLEVLGDLV